MNTIGLDEVVTTGDNPWNQAGTVIIEDATGYMQTLSYTSIVAGTEALDNAGSGGDPTGENLAGVVGWVDNGYCSINYAVEDVTISFSGAGYTSAPTVTFEAPPAGGTTATATATVADGVMTAITINNHGDGYDSIPDITVTGGGGSSQAVLVANITGTISSDTACTAVGGTWSSSSLADNEDVVYDHPGELQERDENLGVKFTLAVRPLGDDNGNTIFGPRFGGNRITHINIYSNKYEDDTEATVEAEDMAFMASFNLEKGYEKADGAYNSWSASGNQYKSDSDYIGSMSDENFQTRTGLFPDTKSIEARWLDAVVINRRAYVGNVMCKDEGGTMRAFPDKILKSVPNSFDTFPFYDSLDVVVNDGDEITALDTWGGRLLQFKKKTLYLIDITTSPEYLAATFRFRGIEDRNAKVKTDVGVAFANANGVFMFNGESIDRLSKGKIDETWRAYYSAGDIQMGFNAPEQQIIITKGGTSEFFMFDIMTRSWTRGTGNRLKDTNKTNFIQYKDKLIQAAKNADSSVDFYEWNATYANGSMGDNSDFWHSKVIDFGNPIIDSFVYNVKITYKASATTNVFVNFVGNNGTTEVEYATNYTKDACLPSTSGIFQTVEVKHTGTVKCKTFVMKILESTDGSEAVNDDFVITDISIVYRDKRVR